MGPLGLPHMPWSAELTLTGLRLEQAKVLESGQVAEADGMLAISAES